MDTESKNIALSDARTSDDPLVRFAGAYRDKPYVRALFAFMTGLIPIPPLADAARELMAAGVEEIRSDRQRTFFDELAKGEQNLTDELIRSEDFLHAFFSTYTAAMRTRQREKIRMFARLLLTGVREEQLGSDVFEEFISILNDLSPREMQILILLKQFEDDNPVYFVTSPATFEWAVFLEELDETLNLPKETATSLLVRLQRTGLSSAVGGLYPDHTSGISRTTPLFSEFMRWVASDTEADLSRTHDNE